MDAHLDLGFRDDRLAFIGGAHLAGLTVAHPMLAPQPVPHLGFDARIKGMVDTKERTLKLSEAGARLPQPARDSSPPTWPNLGRKPRFAATLQGAAAALSDRAAGVARRARAVPAGLQAERRRSRPTCTSGSTSRICDDARRSRRPRRHRRLQGAAGAGVGVVGPACRRRSSRRCEYEPGKWMTFIVGPEIPDWVPFAEISPYLVNSIMTTEDNGFFKHRGFISSEFRAALQQNLQRGDFRLGASSITMQMMKNVLLVAGEDAVAQAAGAVPDLVPRAEPDEGADPRALLQRDRVRPAHLRHRAGDAALLRQERRGADAAGGGVLLVDPAQPEAALRPVLPRHGCSTPSGTSTCNASCRRMHERGRLTDDEYEQARWRRR